MNFTEWFNVKTQGINKASLADRLKISEETLEKLLSGEITPNMDLMVKIMYLFNLSDEERIEYFSAIAVSTNLSTEVVYKLISLHIAEKAEENNLDAISITRR